VANARTNVVRVGGYAPIEDYAAIGDGRTIALVARDGSVDWLPAPELSSPSVFAAILDAERGGRFALAPVGLFDAERRYRGDTNVLETTFATSSGVVRVADALVLGEASERHRRLVRRVEGLAGEVALEWQIDPRFDFSRADVELSGDETSTRARGGGVELLAQTWNAGKPARRAECVSGRFSLALGESADLVAAVGLDDPPANPTTRDDAARTFDDTHAAWESWSGELAYEGPFREAVVRSALALKLLVHEPAGSIAAAATTSLPEVIGGIRNWDYRYSWIRDASLALDALLELGCVDEASRFFTWLESSCHDTAPELQILYTLDGSGDTDEAELDLTGHRGSRPVRTGNNAATQLQLGVYGDVLQTAWLYGRRGHALGEQMRGLLAQIADLVCEIWRRPDRGIWEVRHDPRQFTHSKMMCAIALDRACDLAERDEIPGGGIDRWRREGAAVRSFVERSCWSDDHASYVRSADEPDDLDASLLLSGILGYSAPGDERLAATLAIVRRDLGEGPYVYRYHTEDSLAGREGAFLACSFWVATVLARMGRLDAAAEALEAALGLGNDVGLFSEEIDPSSGAFLGNFPQAFTHLALVNAAVTLARRA